jgi:hypothetical protein
MGLFVVLARFPYDPPAEEELRTDIVHWAGTSRGIDSVRKRNDRELEIYVDMDPVTRPYLIRILAHKQAQLLDFGAGEPRIFEIPKFAGVPWRELSCWRRLWVVTAFYLGLGATIFRGP